MEGFVWVEIIPTVWFDKFSDVVQFGFRRSTSDHSVFTRQSPSGIIILIVYVDIIISSNDSVGIANLKLHMRNQFHTKDLGSLR